MLVGYARISKRDESHSQQIDALTAAGCGRVFIEQLSGAKRDRPELAAALAKLSPGDVLVVWKLDRLARSVRQLAATVEHLQKRNIGLKILSRMIDTTKANGVDVFNVFGAIAEFERELAVERGQARLSSTGRVGRKPAMGEPEIERAKAMLADPSLTVVAVARQMGVQPSTLYRHIPGGRSALSEQAA